MAHAFQYRDMEGRRRDVTLAEDPWDVILRCLFAESGAGARPMTEEPKRMSEEASVEYVRTLREVLEIKDGEQVKKTVKSLSPDLSVSLAALAAEDDIEKHILARYTLLYVLSYEEARVMRVFQRMAERNDLRLYSWSFHKGLLAHDDEPLLEQSENPGQVIDWCLQRDEDAIFVLKDFHAFLSDPAIIRRVRDAVQAFRNRNRSIVFLSPVCVLPTELERDVTVFSYPLPQVEELSWLLWEMVQQSGVNEDYLTREEQACDDRQKCGLQTERRAHLVNGCLGLTLQEAGNLFSKAIARRGGIFFDSVAEIIQEKEQLIRKSGFLEFYPSGEQFTSVGGMENLKQWLASRAGLDNPMLPVLGLAPPKGILLLGVPGCGKSLCARAIAAEWKLPLFRLDLGRIFGGLVGETEANMRRSISIAEAAAPCVLWIDEIEKGFAGVWGGNTDVTSRIFGTFLTWMQEKESRVFVVATANDISDLPPEFLRKGRFDEIFFLDLPNAQEREQIFRIHLAKRKLDPGHFPLQDFARSSAQYSGAEIEQIVISAMFHAFGEGSEVQPDHIRSSIREMVPLTQTAESEVREVRRRSLALAARRAGAPEKSAARL